MEKQPLISVIVPVYNVEEYLPRCLDSIINQTYTNLEILLIDDGATDNSGAICDEYAQKDNRIRVFHKENGGVSSARNMGLDNATGEYVGFIDSDDYVELEYFEVLLKVALDTRADIVKHALFDNKWKDKNKIVTIPAVDFDFSQTEFGINHASICAALFKRDIIAATRLALDLYVGEDLFFYCNVLKRANTVSFLSRVMYYYEQRETSAMHSVYNEKKFTEIAAWERSCELFKGENLRYETCCAAFGKTCRLIFFREKDDKTFRKVYKKKVLYEYRKKHKYVLKYIARTFKQKLGYTILYICPSLFLKIKSIV